MDKTDYANRYRHINFRLHPERYIIGKGEQGVLIAEPYKSEILPHWRFKTPQIAKQSAETIYNLFLNYRDGNDFVGMDMARKYLQMGFTRARRYANHASGRKYDSSGAVKPQEPNSESSLKAESARIFLAFYQQVMEDEQYQALKKKHLLLEKKKPKS
ncbi:Uncharacterised protein [Legionella beliardensis]|uniref:Cytoplasmic protein n=1 Tax=Legionella beliardensis TaxID=91822 RepID=A0A378I309_9GAMM|nr:DUF4385 domain-containing protein [Legionella beliardensis]STX29130.1 Uncharacterised protein [Legionella beliardensis]